jgi:hypothetical protein
VLVVQQRSEAVVIAALFVQERGVYFGRLDVDPWPEARDARRYAGPWSVVAHPPCAAWGRYAKPTPQSTARGPLLGDDGGCFRAALASVERYGGVLEHPRDSKAWRHPLAGTAERPLPVPGPRGWTKATNRPGWACLVDQGHYGHRAQKPTWLYYVGDSEPPSLVWGPSDPPALGSGARRGNLESLSKRERASTPAAFADVLVGLAHASRGHACRAFDPDSACPECQIVWAQMVEEMSRPGANVRVTLPPDVAPWFDENAYGASWEGYVLYANGDSLDIMARDDAEVEPVDITFCRPWRPRLDSSPRAG